jgi:GNAT superfamily N-acetyltransferase
LEDSDETGYELNEVSWWSGWTETLWLGKDAYLFFSKHFGEYFFNRGGFVKVTARIASLVDLMEVEFAKRDLKSYIFLRSDSLNSRLLQHMERRRYKIADQMSVMEVDEPLFQLNGELVLATGAKVGLQQWADAYLRSFYGDVKLMEKVMGILERVSRDKDTSLVLAELDEKPAGVLALHRTEGLLGAYCVGTVPEMRGKHVASTILDFANKLAKDEGRKLILQTILSDSVEPLYIKLGFRRVYTKELFVKGYDTP